MKFNKLGIAAVVVLALLLGLRFFMGRGAQGDDQAQIEQALEDSIKASKEGRPGGVMDKLSGSLRFNDIETSGNRGQIANYIKNNKPDVEVINKRAVIAGNEAYIVSPVNIKVGLLGQSFERELKEVRMVFRKEEDREYLVFPVTKWKLAEITVPDASVDEFWQFQ